MQSVPDCSCHIPVSREGGDLSVCGNFDFRDLPDCFVNAFCRTIRTIGFFYFFHLISSFPAVFFEIRLIPRIGAVRLIIRARPVF